MEFVYNFSHVSALARILSENPSDRSLDRLHERLEDFLMDKDVVGRNAGLARVAELELDQLTGSVTKINSTVHNDGAFTSKF